MRLYAQLLSCVRLFRTPWTVARQAPLSTEFSRQKYWHGLSSPSTWEPQYLYLHYTSEMVEWHHGLNGHGSEWTPGNGGGQGGLACCDSWGRKESDTTERLDWTELNWILTLSTCFLSLPFGLTVCVLSSQCVLCVSNTVYFYTFGALFLILIFF